MTGTFSHRITVCASSCASFFLSPMTPAGAYTSIMGMTVLRFDRFAAVRPTLGGPGAAHFHQAAVRYT